MLVKYDKKGQLHLAEAKHAGQTYEQAIDSSLAADEGKTLRDRDDLCARCFPAKAEAPKKDDSKGKGGAGTASEAPAP